LGYEEIETTILDAINAIESETQYKLAIALEAGVILTPVPS
jgi:hypothetical protein